MLGPTLKGGFANPATDAAAAFRTLMDVMARPGRIGKLTGVTPPEPLDPATGAVVLTLCDPDTPLCLRGRFDTPDVRGWVAFHTGAPFATAADSTFAVGVWDDLMPLTNYPVGISDYPDRSATLIVQMGRLSTEGAILKGPGIKDSHRLSLPDIQSLQENALQFPLGLDFFWTCGNRIAALPRSTRITPSPKKESV